MYLAQRIFTCLIAVLFDQFALSTHKTAHALSHVPLIGNCMAYCLLLQVDVDVYRSVQKVRVEPSHGATSFLQEGLSRWRELNSAADWLRVAAELNDITQTLPQILHHEEQVGQS